jgi:hypothetical protein
MLLSMATIRRSWKDTIVYALFGIGSAAGTWFAHGWAAGASGIVWLIAWALTLFAGVMAIAFFWIAARESGRAACPGCGASVANLDAKVAFRAVACKGCGRYVACRSGELSMVADDFVSDSPVFAAPLPQNVSWPALCCACGAPSTRLVAVEHNESQTGRNVALGAAGLAVGVLAVRTGGGRTFRVEIPSCDQHTDGAKLDTTDSSTSGLEIKVRSYAFWRDFQDRNVGQKV